MLTPRLILGALTLLRGLHVIDGGALMAGVIAGIAVAVVVVAQAGADELSSILLALTVFITVFGFTAGLLTLLRTRKLLRGAGTTPASRMPLAVAAVVGKSLVNVGLGGASLLAASAILRWVGVDGLVATVAGLVLAVAIYLGLRRLGRAPRIRELSARAADRINGPPAATNDVAER